MAVILYISAYITKIYREADVRKGKLLLIHINLETKGKLSTIMVSNFSKRRCRISTRVDVRVK